MLPIEPVRVRVPRVVEWSRSVHGCCPERAG
jgi:hypothetical protein